MAAMLLAGCDRVDLSGLVVPASAPVEERVAESLQLNTERGPRVLMAAADEYRMHVCSDVHTTAYPQRFERFVARLRADSRAVAGLLLGDIVDRRGAMPVAAAVADSAGWPGNGAPLCAIVGNHDLLFDQWNDYKHLFGSSTYSFIVVTPNYRDLYVMLDSGGGCHGRRQMEWLAEVLRSRHEYRHCVVCTHVNLFRTDHSQFVSGNLPLEETYQMARMLADADVNLCLQGHDHHRKSTQFEGVEYVTLDCLKDASERASWLLLDAGERLRWQFVDD